MSASSQLVLSVLLIPAGKIKCYINGTLRNNTPEEHVRQRVARSLVEEYHYNKADIEVEYPIKMGSKTKCVDLAIFPGGVSHEHSIIKFFAGSTPCNPAKSTIGFFPCLNVLVNRHF